MTTFIPSLTLPASVFANPAASVLLPIAVGSAVGFSVRRRSLPPFQDLQSTKTFTATGDQKSYMALKQPPYRPSPQVFGPVWTGLYGLMGYAAHRAYTTGMATTASTQKHLWTKHGATLYTIQLGLNLLWMPLFFVAKRPIEATVDVVALTGVTGYLTYLWGQVDPVAGWCLVPYLGWLGYATYLSAGVGYLNNWTTKDKEVDSPPYTKDSKFVDEEGN
ncbi:hypothetical protein B7463_g1995, partial [Scytalidium lignicola]